MKQERGSALLLVVFLILLLTMLGLAIIGATLGGAQRSMTKEKDVQSLHLAEMALNQAVAQIQLYFDKKGDSIEPDKLADDMDAIAVLVNEEGMKQVKSNLPRSSGTIKRIKTPDSVNTGADFGDDYVITITAEANVDGVVRELEQQVTLNSFPEFLRYAFGSKNNVYINGSPFLIGNVYAGKSLYIKNKAEYKFAGKDGRQSTMYPFVRGNVYLEGMKKVNYCDEIGNPPCNNAETSTYKPVTASSLKTPAERLEEVLGINPGQVVERDSKQFVEVNIEESFLDKLAEAAGYSKLERSAMSKLNILKPIEPSNPNDPNTLNRIEVMNKLVTKIAGNPVDDFQTSATSPYYLLHEPKPLPSDHDPDEKDQLDYDNKVAAFRSYFSRDNLSGSILYRGNLVLDGSTLPGLQYSEADKQSHEMVGTYYRSNWFIVNGDLAITNQTELPMNIRGNILVTGNLTISGKVKMDATIYAMGSTIIQDATIEGLPGSDGNKRELVLISKGEIVINRVTSFNPIEHEYGSSAYDESQDPPILQSFFYTDDEAELYGVGSAFWIKGGFFAKGDLTINAYVGNTTEAGDESNPYLNFKPKSQHGFSRFVIDYNKEIYKHQNAGLPRVKQINIAVGKKRFSDST